MGILTHIKDLPLGTRPEMKLTAEQGLTLMFMMVTIATYFQLGKLSGQPQYEGWGFDPKAQRMKRVEIGS